MELASDASAFAQKVLREGTRPRLELPETPPRLARHEAFARRHRVDGRLALDRYRSTCKAMAKFIRILVIDPESFRERRFPWPYLALMQARTSCQEFFKVL